MFGDLPMKNDSCPAVKLPKGTASLLMTAPSEGTKATDRQRTLQVHEIKQNQLDVPMSSMVCS